MSSAVNIPAFGAEPWYVDPGDHRCPHDAWLESVEISEPAVGERNQSRKTAITIRLLGAYHDGYIILRYFDVLSYTLSGIQTARGLGDWLDDCFEPTVNDAVRHKILWAGFGSDQESRWEIEAREIHYEWQPIAST